MHALVIAGVIQSYGPLPTGARRLDTQEWVTPRDGQWSPAQLAACGYVQVATTARPADTATTTFDYSVVLVAGVPTEAWSERPKTQAEIDHANNDTQRTSLMQQLNDGIADLEAARDAASNDVAVADGQRTQALAIKAAATTKRGQVAAFVPSATYKATDMTAVRDAIVDVLDRQVVIVQALADGFDYRKANDANAVKTSGAIVWLGRLISGRLLG